jgi:hypothetical protein
MSLKLKIVLEDITIEADINHVKFDLFDIQNSALIKIGKDILVKPFSIYIGDIIQIAMGPLDISYADCESEMDFKKQISILADSIQLIQKI